MQCSKCDFENVEGAKFCNNCGTAISSEIECASCKTLNPQNSRFCNNCGAKLSDNENQSAEIKMTEKLKPTDHFNPDISYGEFTDPRDGQTYRTVVMPDGKTWMAENLNFATEDGSWCYDDDPAYGEKYGRLYDWETAQMACPAGWHLPSNEEWEALIDSVGGNEAAVKRLISKTGWGMNENNGTDDFGFSALPGGGRIIEVDDDSGEHVVVLCWLGVFGYYWTATECAESDDFLCEENWEDKAAVIHIDSMYCYMEGWQEKTNGYSVRCVRND